MALYVIGDLHLSLTADKPMDVFGGKWAEHAQRLQQAFSALTAEDVTVLCGDLSWGMDLAEAAADLRFVDAFPGRKIILKGNHDYWWATAAKMSRFFEQEGIRSVEILHNNCILWNDLALCGTRGWFFEEETGGAHDKKIMNREIMRLEASLKAAGDREKLVFLHYPPLYRNYRCPEILGVLREFSVRECFYGHIHGRGAHAAVIGEEGGILYRLISADHLDFYPYKVR